MSSQPTIKPDGPQAVVAMLRVADVARSIEFYRQLGFELANTFEPEGRLCWASMRNGQAELMLTLAEGAPQSSRPAALYVYVADVKAYRDALAAKGLAVSELIYPFWAEDGEFQVVDPDGFTVFVA